MSEDRRLSLESQISQFEYEKVLKESIKNVQVVIFVTLTTPMMTSSRYYVLALYVEQLSPLTSTFTISCIVFASLMWSTIVTFILTQLGDKFNHDKVFLISLTLQVIGIFIESIAINVSIFSIGFFISSGSTMAISFAYIAWILPHKHAVLYISKLFTYSSILYLLGPVIAGFIVEYLNYRSVFIMNAIILLLAALFALYFTYGSQKILEEKQLNLSSAIYTNNDDERFPVFLNSLDNNNTDTSWNSFLQNIAKCRLIILGLSLISNSFCWAMEAMLLYYLALFIKNRFVNVPIIHTSFMLTTVTLSFGIGNILIPKIISRIIPKYIGIITIAASLMTINWLLCSIINNVTFYWICLPIQGFIFGVVNITTEMCILEMQLKEHSGKVSATKGSLKIILRGVLVLMVGIFWVGPYYNSLWHFQAICSLAICTLSLPIYYFSKSIYN